MKEKDFLNQEAQKKVSELDSELTDELGKIKREKVLHNMEKRGGSDEHLVKEVRQRDNEKEENFFSEVMDSYERKDEKNEQSDKNGKKETSRAENISKKEKKVEQDDSAVEQNEYLREKIKEKRSGKEKEKKEEKDELKKETKKEKFLKRETARGDKDAQKQLDYLKEKNKSIDEKTIRKEGWEKVKMKEERLEELSKELAKARDEYIKKDMELDEKAGGIMSFFKLSKNKLGQASDQVQGYKESYENALKQYKDAVLESGEVDLNEETKYEKDEKGELRKKESDKETLLRHYEYMEYLNLESRKATLKFEEKPVKEELKRYFGNISETYRKLLSSPAKLGNKIFDNKFGGAIFGAGVTMAAMSSVNKALLSSNPAYWGWKLFSFSATAHGINKMEEMKEANRKTEEGELKVREGMEEVKRGKVDLGALLDDKINDVHGRVLNEKVDKVSRRNKSLKKALAWTVAGSVAGHYLGEYFAGEDSVDGADSVSGEGDGKEVERVGTEGSDIEKQAENVGGLETAEKGDSVWSMAEEQLEKRGFFDNLSGSPEEVAAQKTYMVDAIKDQVIDNPEKFGLGNDGQVNVGQELNFSSIFEDKSVINDMVNGAQGLSPEEVENINSYSQLDHAESVVSGENGISAVEKGIVEGLNISEGNYEDIKNMQVGELIQEVGKYENMLSESGGDEKQWYFWNEYEEYAKMRDFIVHQSGHEVINDMTVDSFLQDLDPDKISNSDVRVELSDIGVEVQEYPDTYKLWTELNKEYISQNAEQLNRQYVYTMENVLNVDKGAWNMGVKFMSASDFIANELPQNNAPQFYENMVNNLGEEVAQPLEGERAIDWIHRMVVESSKS